MTSPEYIGARAIKRGQFKMDVITNVVRVPDGHMVPLSELEALVFATLNPPNISLHSGKLANRVTATLFELCKTNPNRKHEFLSISAEKITNAKQRLKQRKLPCWPK